jgi:hypothetical protein
MGYPKDLEDYTDAQLIVELYRRHVNRDKGVCDYCGNNADTKPCKYPARHALPVHKR